MIERKERDNLDDEERDNVDFLQAFNYFSSLGRRIVCFLVV